MEEEMSIFDYALIMSIMAICLIIFIPLAFLCRGADYIARRWNR